MVGVRLGFSQTTGAVQETFSERRNLVKQFEVSRALVLNLAGRYSNPGMKPLVTQIRSRATVKLHNDC